MPRLRTRTLRIIGAVLALMGIPSFFINRADYGLAMALVLLIIHLGVGAFVAFALPGIQAMRRPEQRR